VDDVLDKVAQVQTLGSDQPVHVLSPKFSQGLEQVVGYLTRGRTAAFPRGAERRDPQTK